MKENEIKNQTKNRDKMMYAFDFFNHADFSLGILLLYCVEDFKIL